MYIFSNEVDSFDSVSFLSLSPKLHTVTFRGNPIASDPEYQNRMARYFPRLKCLDPASRRARYRLMCVNTFGKPESLSEVCNPRSKVLATISKS